MKIHDLARQAVTLQKALWAMTGDLSREVGVGVNISSRDVEELAVWSSVPLLDSDIDEWIQGVVAEDHDPVSDEEEYDSSPYFPLEDTDYYYEQEEPT